MIGNRRIRNPTDVFEKWNEKQIKTSSLKVLEEGSYTAGTTLCWCASCCYFWPLIFCAQYMKHRLTLQRLQFTPKYRFEPNFFNKSSSERGTFLFVILDNTAKQSQVLFFFLKIGFSWKRKNTDSVAVYCHNGLYGGRGTFFRFQVYEKLGILLVEVYEMVGKYVISLC